MRATDPATQHPVHISMKHLPTPSNPNTTHVEAWGVVAAIGVGEAVRLNPQLPLCRRLGRGPNRLRGLVTHELVVAGDVVHSAPAFGGRGSRCHALKISVQMAMSWPVAVWSKNWCERHSCALDVQGAGDALAGCGGRCSAQRSCERGRLGRCACS